MRSTRLALSAAVPVVGQLAIVSTAARPGPSARSLPGPAPSTTTTVVGELWASGKATPDEIEALLGWSKVSSRQQGW